MDTEQAELDDWLSDPHWLCVDCSTHTGAIGEYYMVTDALWARHGVQRGMLCLMCLESRVGRRLVPSDFPWLPVNSHEMLPKSDFARSRMYGSE